MTLLPCCVVVHDLLSQSLTQQPQHTQTWKPLSAKVVVTRTDGSRVAFIAKKLSNPIKDAKLTRSGDRITLVLFKIEDLQW